MRALLLAAGYGTRLRPITNLVPKCLVNINGRPLLDYWIQLLSDGGVVDILVNLHYLPDIVRTYVSSCIYPVNIYTSYEEKLLGTGGTLLRNRNFFGNEPIILIHADNLSFFDMREFVRRYEMREEGVEITMMTFNTSEPANCGIVELDDCGIVKAFYEKSRSPPGNLANAAVYILSTKVITFLSNLGKEVIDFSTEVIPHFIGRINTYHNNIYHRDIGSVNSLVLALEEYPYAISKKVAKRK